jgi:hypothetical protein
MLLCKEDFFWMGCELHREKLNGVILKIHFEKAYDKVKWSFLQHVLGMKDFSHEWPSIVFVFGGTIAIKANDDVGRYFQTKKGFKRSRRNKTRR